MTIESPLDERTVLPDPIQQFTVWFEKALATESPFPEAMTLATATSDAKPSARVVLLKSFDANGFVFYTNYESRKGIELASNHWAALVFYWSELNRQVRIEGEVEKVSPEESDQYFQTRPRDSQIGALASPQSRTVRSRKELEENFEEIEKRYKGQSIPRHAHWGGYRMKPRRIEFWQGREARLHDRILYELTHEGKWMISRLAP